MQPSAPKNEVFFLLLQADGTAETVELGGERCLCIFTDEYRVAAFDVARHGRPDGGRDVPTRKFDGVHSLREFLRGNESKLAAQGVWHFAMNPAPKTKVDRVPIRAFIAAGDAMS